MDTITHTLSGLCLAELGFTRKLGAARARVLGVVAANVVDLDLLTLLGGPERYLFDHRGFTHGVVLWLVLAPVLAWLALHLRPARPAVPGAGTSALGLALLGLASHDVLDMLSTWGPRLWAPLDRRPVALEYLVMVDPVVWVLLGFGLWGQLLRVPPQRAASWALVGVGVYAGWCGATNRLAERRAGAWARMEGFDADTVVAFPEAPGGLSWSTVAFNDEEALWRPVDILGAPLQATRMPRGLEEPLVQEFLATDLGASWLRFARIPVAASVETATGGYEVWMRDLRFVNRSRPHEGLVPLDLEARFSPGGLLMDHRWYTTGPAPNPPSPLPGIPGVTQPLAVAPPGVDVLRGGAR